MTSTKETRPSHTSMEAINMSSPLVLRDWNEAFKLSTPVRSSPKHTPSKTNWKLGAPQVAPFFNAHLQIVVVNRRIIRYNNFASAADSSGTDACHHEDSKSAYEACAARYAAILSQLSCQCHVWSSPNRSRAVVDPRSCASFHTSSEWATLSAKVQDK